MNIPLTHEHLMLCHSDGSICLDGCDAMAVLVPGTCIGHRVLCGCATCIDARYAAIQKAKGE